MQINSLFRVVLVNIGLVYLSLFGANLYTEYSLWSETAYRAERQRLETSARAVDARYFAQCLARDHVQVFYPDLVSHQQQFRDIARKNRFLPLGPVPHAKTAYCNEGYGFTTYQSDRFGFRNLDESWNQAVDVLIVGDSFVQGACVADQFALSRQISNDLGVNAINVGTGSNGPNHYRLLIDVFVPMTKPKHVVLVLFPNDNVVIPEGDPYSATQSVGDQSGYSRSGVSPEGRAFYNEVRPLMAPTPESTLEPIDCRATDLTFAALRPAIARDHSAGGSNVSTSAFVQELYNGPSTFRGLVSLRALRAVAKASLAPAPLVLASPNATRDAINSLFNHCQGACEPILVFLPTSKYWRPDPRSNAYFSFVLEHVKQAHAGKPMRLVDARALIDDESLQDYAPIGPHFSTEAYRRIGLALGQAISGR